MNQNILSLFEDSAGLPVENVGIMKLAISLASQVENGSLLLTTVFLRCCKLLPKEIKIMLRTKESEAAFAVDSLVGILSTSIAKVETFDENTILMSTCVVDNCIAACLKYGMMEQHDLTMCSIFGGCLKIVRLLMGKGHGRTQLGRLTPLQVHAMTVSHSSFQHSISQRRSALFREGFGMTVNQPEFCNGLSRQLELIRLLLCTVSLDASNVKIDTDTWTVILSVYNASTDLVDVMLRRLLFLYERNGCCQDEVSPGWSFTVGTYMLDIIFTLFPRRYF